MRKISILDFWYKFDTMLSWATKEIIHSIAFLPSYI